MRLILIFSFFAFSFLIFSCSGTVYNVEVSDIREITDFNDGLAGVLVGDYWGFIDTKGKFVIEPQYRFVRQFNDNYAAVQLNNKWGFIDKNGNMIIPAQYEDAKYFSEKTAPVKKDNRWGYINSSGNIEVEFQFEDALPFSEGLAAVKQNGQWGFIKKSGKFKIEPRYTSAGEFNSNLAPVLENGQWGYIDNSGEYRINPIYEGAKNFSLLNTSNINKNFLAAVNDDGNWGYIDTKGRFVINPKYDDALSFSDEVAWVKTDNKWGLIDGKDRVIIDFNYDYAGMFENGFGLIIHNGKKFYIDKKGRDAGILKISADIDETNLDSGNDDNPVLTPYVGGEKCATWISALSIYNFSDEKLLINAKDYLSMQMRYDDIVLEPKATFIPTVFEFKNNKEFISNITISTFNYDTIRYVCKNPQGTDNNSKVAENRNYLLLLSRQGLYLTSNRGVSWVKSSNGIKENPTDFDVSGDLVFAGTSNGVFYANNYGNSDWKSFGPEGISIKKLFIYKNNIFASSRDRIFRTDILKPEWEELSETGGEPTILFMNDTMTFIRVGYSNPIVKYSKTELNSWVELNKLPRDEFTYDITIAGDKILAATDAGIYNSSDLGKHWKETNMTNCILSLETVGDKLYASGNGVYYSEDAGTTWENIYLPKSLNEKYSISEFEGHLFLYGYSDYGSNFFMIYETPGTRYLANLYYYTTIFKYREHTMKRYYPLAHLKITDLITGNKVTKYEKYTNKKNNRISEAEINALYTKAGNFNIWAQATIPPIGGKNRFDACRDVYVRPYFQGWYNPMVVIIEKEDTPFVPKY